MNEEIRTIPYVTTSTGKVNSQIDKLLFLFELLIKDDFDSKGVLDVNPMDSDGNPIPLKPAQGDYLIIGKRLEINTDYDTTENSYTEENISNFALWLNDILLNSMMTDEWAIIEMMKFASDDEMLNSPTAQLEWHVHDGMIISSGSYED